MAAPATGRPPPTCIRSPSPRSGTERATALKSLTTARVSKRKRRRIASIENDHGWLVRLTRSPVTGQATERAARRGRAPRAAPER